MTTTLASILIVTYLTASFSSICIVVWEKFLGKKIFGFEGGGYTGK